jgi:hypothetical protein
MDSYSVREEIARVLPLRVAASATTEAFFNLWGPGWSLAINCDWVLSRRGLAIATWVDDQDRIDQAVADLQGRSIVGIEIDDELLDPVIIFDHGVELITQADTALDPWVLRVDGLPVILVGRGPSSRSSIPEFGADFEVTIPSDLPPTVDRTYHFEAEAPAQIDLMITVQLSGGASWTGRFYAPRSQRRAVSGIYRTPTATGICVINQGCVFVGDVLAPAGIAPVDDLDEVLAVERDAKSGLLYVSTGWTVAALGAAGLVWQTPRLAIEDLRLDSVQGTSLHGTADPDGDGARQFTIEVITGDVRGGATGLR